MNNSQFVIIFYHDYKYDMIWKAQASLESFHYEKQRKISCVYNSKVLKAWNAENNLLKFFCSKNKFGKYEFKKASDGWW